MTASAVVLQARDDIVPFIFMEQKPIFDVSQSNVSADLPLCADCRLPGCWAGANLVPVINVTEMLQTAPSSGHSAARQH